MKKMSAKRFRYILIGISSIILIYDLYVQSWLGAASMALLVLAMFFSNRHEAREKNPN